MTTAEATRLGFYVAVARYYGVEHDDEEPDQFAVIRHGGSVTELQTCGSLQEAFDLVGDAILDGDDGQHDVYDLDTGRIIDYHVATPVVTVAEDQISRSVLLEDD